VRAAEGSRRSRQTEIQLADAIVVEKIGRPAGQRDAACFQRVGAVRDFERHSGILLNEDNADFFVAIDLGGEGANCEEVRLLEPVTIFEKDFVDAGISVPSGMQLP
jgi:hypothetical protein